MPDRYSVSCKDGDCWRRRCMWPGEGKGAYVQGRGYVSYHKRPVPVCMTRHLHGCPGPVPEPDTETARCCYAPVYRGRGKTRTCLICGAQAPHDAARLLNILPVLPGVPCRHQNVGRTVLVGWSECPDCFGIWDKSPEEVRAFDPPGRTVDEMVAETRRRIAYAPPPGPD